MAESPATPAPVPIPPVRSNRLRRGLLLLGPIVAGVVAVWVYASGGRFVSTDNAYVKADKVAVSAQVEGPILDVKVAENQRVRRGDVLFDIDSTPFRVNVARARAGLENIRTDIEALKAAYREKAQELDLAGSNAAYADREFTRQAELLRKDMVSESQFDSAKHDLDVARRQVTVLQQGLQQLLADLAGNPDIQVEAHPRYRAAAADLDRAELDLGHTVVTAPFDGVASKTPEPGLYVTAGMPVMSIVADRNAWIEANFKETELTHVETGQSVQVRIDTYPGRVWRGRVRSISQATGAEFSVLPAQNATGNWIKVVQRIPVRIALDHEGSQPVLRAGMSAVVEIDTGRRRGLARIIAGLFARTGAAGDVAAAQAASSR